MQYAVPVVVVDNLLSLIPVPSKQGGFGTVGQDARSHVFKFCVATLQSVHDLIKLCELKLEVSERPSLSLALSCLLRFAICLAKLELHLRQNGHARSRVFKFCVAKLQSMHDLIELCEPALELSERPSLSLALSCLLRFAICLAKLEPNLRQNGLSQNSLS